MASVSEILAASQKQNEIKVVDSDKTGFSGMTSEDFVKLLIAQLQNQDPSEPMSNESLMTQIQQMRSLQSSLDLEATLKTITLSQQLTSSSGFIGKTITASNGNSPDITGKVDRIVISNGKTLLGIGSNQVEFSQVKAVSA